MLLLLLLLFCILLLEFEFEFIPSKPRESWLSRKPARLLNVLFPRPNVVVLVLVLVEKERGAGFADELSTGNIPELCLHR